MPTRKLPDELPALPTDFARENPEVWEAYRKLGKACSEAGPLDDKTRRLVKLAFAIAMRSEGGVHSHVRRALREGVGKDELLHVATLAIPALASPTPSPAAVGLRTCWTTGTSRRAEAGGPTSAGAILFFRSASQQNHSPRCQAW